MSATNDVFLLFVCFVRPEREREREEKEKNARKTQAKRARGEGTGYLDNGVWTRG